MPDAKTEAMRDFVLSSGSNLQTAFLVHDAIESVRAKLITEFAKRIKDTLSKEPGWSITASRLIQAPFERWAELRWSPDEWADYGWGLCLNAEIGPARGFIFGLHATAKSNTDPEYIRNSSKYPAMPDEDRRELADRLASVLRDVGHGQKSSAWWPCYTFLPPDIRDLASNAALMKIAYAVERSTERDLVRGKPIDEFIIDAFQAARLAILPILSSRTIVPVPRAGE